MIDVCCFSTERTPVKSVVGEGKKKYKIVFYATCTDVFGRKRREGKLVQLPNFHQPNLISNQVQCSDGWVIAG